MLSAVNNIVKVILFFLGLWGERNSTRVRKKKEIAKEITDAMAETNPKLQASMLNHAVQSIDRLNRVRK
ncbi:MAG: hypothetical protein M0P69_01555 [Bacteroidales bacterium]|nr:hypothetical protein [Bacteroidales bacterium]